MGGELFEIESGKELSNEELRSAAGKYRKTTVVEEVPTEKTTFTERFGMGADPEKKTLFGLPENLEKKVFPTASQLPKGGKGTGIKGFGQEIVAGGVGALDLLSLPTRALGTIRGQKLEDP